MTELEKAQAQIQEYREGIDTVIEYLNTGKDPIGAIIILNNIINPAKLSKNDIEWADKILQSIDKDIDKD